MQHLWNFNVPITLSPSYSFSSAFFHWYFSQITSVLCLFALSFSYFFSLSFSFSPALVYFVPLVLSFAFPFHLYFSQTPSFFASSLFLSLILSLFLSLVFHPFPPQICLCRGLSELVLNSLCGIWLQIVWQLVTWSYDSLKTGTE